MEYKQGLDRVGDSTSFPFPIKLEYDSENIYLTPLWIPETSDILVAKDKITKQPINLLDANELGDLWLCLEVADGKNKFYRPGSKENNKHPRRGGKFHLKGRIGQHNSIYPNFLTLGTRYQIPFFSWFQLFSGKSNGARVARYQGLTMGFGYIRGTFRYGNRERPQRTGIYSNTAKIEFEIH